MIMDMMDSKNIIDPIYWKVLWNAADAGYDMKQMLDSLSPNQFESKLWLVEVLGMFQIKDPAIQLFGGWNGFPLIDLLREEFEISLLENIDLDEAAVKICKNFISTKQLDTIVYRARHANVCEPYQLDSKIDIVINTSSEHMPDLPELIKNKEYKESCIYVLQSNNMFHIEDHCNCVNSKKELEIKSGLTEILYSDSLSMPNGYERYMVIGRV
jgi:hypothetical protein